ncbi:tRNA uridine(34) 5-carboxymethylaminomethyl modification radical SAM/GNAT enzyme Elp3 [Candidatus Woesearchaeota archaeon]|nr:tRNA uridine(34) 5-carboxymethylaminomethyl modification radical SAM/GNAT enzyme Elp3 [Candidatus Woesearchaeota archaeon]
MNAFFDELIAWIKVAQPTRGELEAKKLLLCRKHSMRRIPTTIEVYLHASDADGVLIRPYVQTKPTRTGSGVAVVATMTKPFNCPHGSCTFCPGGLNSFFGDTPKSYTGREPSTMRGRRNEYDAYRIVFNRLEQYILLGQNPDKVDQIIMGGTFTAFPLAYQQDYVYYSFKAYNDFSQLFYENGVLNLSAFKAFFELPASHNDKHDQYREQRITEKILAIKDKEKKTLEEEQTINENSFIRCIGLTIETKPDWAFAAQGIKLLDLGATRIELGVQTIYDEVLKKVNRGHTLADTKKSIADLRDLGFKLNFHMMPGLPGKEGKRLSKEEDLVSLKTLFTDEAYQPDMLKIYPCLVMPGTALERDYKTGIFQPLTTPEAAELIVEAKQFVPEYCRIMRVQRDIPTYVTEAGVDKTNLRQYVDQLAKQQGIRCRCIRCREARTLAINATPQLIIREYNASKGKEFFISIEAEDSLLGFVRLRLPPRSLHSAITLQSGLIRELHVYGSAVAIGTRETAKVQHKGIGKQLMAKAEDIAKIQGKKKMVVISGIGVREYYRKLGYEREGPYMVKWL